MRAESNFADAPPSKIPTCVPSRAFPHGSGVKIFAIDGYFTEKRNFPVKKRSKSATLRYRRAVRQARAREWRRDSRNCSDDLEAEAKAAGDSLDQQFSDDDLLALIRSKGVANAAEE